MFYSAPCRYSISLRKQYRAGFPNTFGVPGVRAAVKAQILKADHFQGCWGWMKEFTK